MKFENETAELFVPDGASAEEALRRTTHIGIGAHPDDLEIMAYHGILECFINQDKWFLGVTVTDGAGSPRNGFYASYSDEDMRRVRRMEQKKAAFIGGYSGAVLLDYPSSAVKDRTNWKVRNDLKKIITVAKPSVIYTHNLADKHDTHVAVAVRVIQALRELPKELHPQKLCGCEVWRDLDWMIDEDKVVFDVGTHENLAAALTGVFDSQICGGKRYDLATMGRRRANATYYETHGTDITSAMIYAMDLTPLIKNPELDIREYVVGHIKRFSEEVSERLRRLT
ncbi:PIG-L family deacetylase [Candidatus Bathyarchaeota archaeon]|nr:MAG: PIG-L family deacetylase [Candidatus Bathyarchaeota archaeon]